MILGAGTFQMPLINAAKKHGLQVICVTPDGDYPGIKAADKVLFHDARDAEFVLEAARREQIDGIISDQAEIFVRPVAYVAEKLGLPGNGYETACLYTDKHLMRKRSKELGLATIESYVVREPDEAVRIFRSLNGTAIIKPVDNCSSRGISKIRSEAELMEKWDEAKQYSESGDIIVERFVEGPQFEVDSIAVNGHVRVLMYADLNEFSIPNVFSSASRLYPSEADPLTVERLLAYSNRINEGFGMKQGISHNEYIMDEKTGEIYLIEAALRGGGTYIASHIAKLETGLDTADFLVKTALGQLDDVPDFEMNKCHAGYACFYLPQGRIVSIAGLDKVEKLDYVVKTKFNDIKTGMMTHALEDKDQRCAVILHAGSRKEMIERIGEIRNIIDIQIETNEGLKGPIWE